MATQFEILTQKLDYLIDGVAQVIAILSDMEEEKDQLALDAEVPDENKPRPKNMNRREVEVKGFNGDTVMVKWADIDPRIIQAIEVATKNQLDYQLYQDASGSVRISVDAEVAHIIRKAMTHQAPVPQVGNREVDVFGVDDEG